jgi:hypothetical protein
MDDKMYAGQVREYTEKLSQALMEFEVRVWISL